MENKMEQFIEFLEEDDGQFLDQVIENLSDEELSEFLKNNPNFIKEIV